MQHLTFRKAQPADTVRIWEILQQAIKRRGEDGSHQWQDGYPNLQIVQKDIGQQVGYVGMLDGNIAVYTALIFNDEPTYEIIDGAWLSEGDFLVIHRVAVANEYIGRGLGKAVFIFAESVARQHSVFSIKVDTNYDNAGLLAILRSQNYHYCGEISVRNTPRKAFEKILR